MAIFLLDGTAAELPEVRDSIVTGAADVRMWRPAVPLRPASKSGPMFSKEYKVPSRA